MIAARFRLVGWVAGCAGAALMCYMASQSVAAERSALAKVDADIARTQGDIARLQTEITARSRAGQVEKWNYTLALQAAKPAQYVSSGIQLASMAGGQKLPLDPAIVASHGAVQTVAYQPSQPAPVPATVAPAPAPVVVAAAPTAPKLQLAAVHPAPSHDAPMIRPAAFVRPKSDRLGGEAAPLLHVASFEKSAKHIEIKAEEPKPVKAKRAEATIEEAKPAKAKPKLARLDDSLLPSDLSKLIAAERKAKPAAKRAL